MSAADVLLAIAGIGVTTNVAAMGWIMKTLYVMRQELSSTHARHEQRITDLNGRVIRLERLWE